MIAAYRLRNKAMAIKNEATHRYHNNRLWNVAKINRVLDLHIMSGCRKNVTVIVLE